MNPLSKIRHRIGRRFRLSPMRLLRALARDGIEINSVVHCGAHYAEERCFYEDIGARRVVWIEGSAGIHSELARLLEKDRAAGKLLGSHAAVHGLLYAKPGISIPLFGYSNAGAANSIYRSTNEFAERWPTVTETGAVEVQLSTTLDMITDAHAPNGADLLTLDLQGAELTALAGGHRTLSRAKIVMCEVSKIQIYHGGAAYEDVVEFFSAAGFEPMHRCRTVDDLVFLKRELI